MHVVIVDGAVGDGIEPPGRSIASGDRSSTEAAGVGAVLVFEGVVRGEEEGREIRGLDYTVYEPMAGRELERIAAEVLGEMGLIGLEVWHSRGFVGVGECSLRVVVRAVHRAEALAGMAAFIDLLKRDVPIWKRVVEAV